MTKYIARNKLLVLPMMVVSALVSVGAVADTAAVPTASVGSTIESARKSAMEAVIEPAADATVHANTPAEQELVQQARAIAGDFQANLKGALMQAMSSGGPVEAINVCRTDAPQIASELSNEGWVIGRTALKVRNPANAPDAWEQEQMQAMNAKLAAGESPDQLTVAEIHDTPDGRTFYFMQPIMTGKLCLACHGSQLAPPVEQALATHYPQDQAVGFSEGDMRGAYTFTKSLPAE